MQFLLFTLDNQFYGMELSFVERVVWSVAIAPISYADSFIAGVINVQGQVMPVINMRKVLKCPDRELALDHKFIIANFGPNLVLWVDNVKGVSDFSDHQLNFQYQKSSPVDHFHYIIQEKDRIIFVYHWEKLLNVSQYVQE